MEDRCTCTGGEGPPLVSSPPLEIPESQTYMCCQFVIPKHYERDVKSVTIPHGFILDRVERMAADITRTYQKTPIHLLCVLKGGHQFFSDLVHFLKRYYRYSDISVPFGVDFVRCQSYIGDESSGAVQIKGADFEDLRGKHVVVTEDIVDTGTTMTKLIAEMWKYEPLSIRVAVLLHKRTPRSSGFCADWVGFSIPDEFVVGYTLDYNEMFRDLDHICIISETGRTRYQGRTAAV